MIRFYNHRIKRLHSIISLCADYLYEPTPDESEMIDFFAPKCWVDAIAHNVDWNVYDAYYINTFSVPRANVSRITDYKKIWGLGGIPKGEYDNFYDTLTTRIYIGFSKLHENEKFILARSSLVVIAPKSEVPSWDELFARLSASGFWEARSNGRLELLHEYLPNSLVLHYDVLECAQLTIIGTDTPAFFPKMCAFLGT